MQSQTTWFPPPPHSPLRLAPLVSFGLPSPWFAPPHKKNRVPMNFPGTRKLLVMVSHNLWARNQKIVVHGNWNPRACIPYETVCFNLIYYYFSGSNQILGLPAQLYRIISSSLSWQFALSRYMFISLLNLP